MKKYIVIVLAFLFAGPMQSFAQIKNARKETVQVNGNCGMCASTIEKSALKKDIAEAVWDGGKICGRRYSIYIQTPRFIC